MKNFNTKLNMVFMDSLLQLTGFFPPGSVPLLSVTGIKMFTLFLSDWHHTGFSMVNAGYPGKPMEA